MIDFSFNNFVQIGVEKILSNIIEGINKDLKLIVFEDCHLLDFIINNMENEFISVYGNDAHQVK
jgi:hypothetical protein